MKFNTSSVSLLDFKAVIRWWYVYGPQAGENFNHVYRKVVGFREILSPIRILIENSLKMSEIDSFLMRERIL
jgi:hypothetical protein